MIEVAQAPHSSPQLRFPEFKGRWDKETVGGVSKIFGRIGYRGYTVQDIVSKGEGAIALSPSNFINNQIDTTKSTYISWFKYEESPEIKILDGDILFVKTGSTYGKTAFVSNIKEKATINPQLVVLKNISISNKFLGYIVTTQTIKKQVEQIVVGGAIPTMSQKELSKMEFGLPAKPEQQKIAAFLTAVDNKIEQLSKKQELLGEYKKGLMQQIFSQSIRFKADDGCDFPDWEEEKKLDDVGSFKSGTGFTEAEQGGKSGVPFFKVSDMNLEGNQKVMVSANNYVNDEQIARLNYKPINKKSVIFAKVGAAVFLERKRIADSFLIDNNMMAFTPTEDIDFIRQWFDTVRLSKYAQVGALPSYNASDLKTIKINLPSLPEQTKIAIFLSSIDNKIEQVGKQLDESKQFKKALLQQMFV
jgi:type I restriction enzyme S subunit